MNSRLAISDVSLVFFVVAALYWQAAVGLVTEVFKVAVAGFEGSFEEDGAADEETLDKHGAREEAKLSIPSPKRGDGYGSL